MVTGLIMGIVFGFMLERSRVFEPAVLIRQFQMRNFLMMKVFFTAMATSMVSIAFLQWIVPDFAFQLKPVTWLANASGGAILGMGVALTGACPGTVLAQMGAGYRDAIFTFVGGLLGAAFFMLIKGPILDPIFFSGEAQAMTFPTLLGIPFGWLALGMVSAIAGMLFFLEKRSSWKKDVGVNFDGLG